VAPTDRQKYKQCLREVEQKTASFQPDFTQTHALDMPLTAAVATIISQLGQDHVSMTTAGPVVAYL